MKIRLIGQRNTTGIGTHYTNFSDAISRRAGVGHLVEEVDFCDNHAMTAAAESSTDKDINICFVGLPLHRNFRGKNIQWVVFETTKPPDFIMDVCKSADQVWVPTSWGRDVLLSQGLDRGHVQVVHEGVNSDVFYPRLGLNSSDPFIFLFVGKYETRKCLEETMQAFAQVYRDDTTVQLVIKTGYFLQDPERCTRLMQLHTDLGCNNIQIIYSGVTGQDMWNLYRGANAFVLPSRGEGWGLPLIEAAAMGVPIISTCWSGPTEFLDLCRTSTIAVDFELEPVHCDEHKMYSPTQDGDYGIWANPQVDSIARAMTIVRGSYPEYQAAAQHNSHAIRNQFSWTCSVDQALLALTKLN